MLSICLRTMHTENHRWHCDYVRLAWDAGFSFGPHEPSVFDRNSLALLDVEHVVRERDIASVERHIPTVLRYSLDESTGVLDATFVKVFRLAQLAIEYLLFCKKYLDGCVAALKSESSRQKEEIAELKEQLESRRSLPTFKCEKCPKLFSAPDYLESHVKRRHSGDAIEATDRLHSEIKELKERLNVAEKSLQEQRPEPVKPHDVYYKFDEFRRQVEREISEIRARNEGGYDRLVGMLDGRRRNVESAYTQTDRGEEPPHRRLVKTTVHSINITDSEGSARRDAAIEERIEAFGDNIDAKISSGLRSIQQQLEEFSEKLRSIESQGARDVVRPQVKPRTKLIAEVNRIDVAVEVKPEVIKRDEDIGDIDTRVEPSETEIERDETVVRIQPDVPEVRVSKRPEAPQRGARRAAPVEPSGSESEAIVVISPVKKPNRKVESTKRKKRLTLSVSVNNILQARSDAVGGKRSLSEKTLRKALHIIGHPEPERKVMKVRYRRASKENESPPKRATPVVTIKNRSLYDTTDSEREPKKCLRYYSDSDSTAATLTDDDDRGRVVQVKEKKKVLFDVRKVIDSSSN